jgi:hypothetical protein
VDGVAVIIPRPLFFSSRPHSSSDRTRCAPFSAVVSHQSSPSP